jgi:dipeptidyl aminopeptidase/acylaminoacyl peptidase
MAQFCRGQSRQIARLQILLAALSLVILSSLCAKAQNLYERPILIVDPDMHTANSKGAAADAAGRFLVTGSEDKTVRIWSASDGKLLRTIRMPAGPGNSGKIYAVAMSPDGNIVAAGGWTGGDPGRESIYLFDRDTGKMTTRIAGLPDVVNGLAFSADGRYLAAQAEIKASAISADEFHDEVAELATYGRVLVLLDACHSGAVTGTGSALTSDAEVLRRRVSANNVTVLTSSTSNEFSREDDKWKHGAFTKVLLDALGKDGDVNHDGFIWMTQFDALCGHPCQRFDPRPTASGRVTRV